MDTFPLHRHEVLLGRVLILSSVDTVLCQALLACETAFEYNSFTSIIPAFLFHLPTHTSSARSREVPFTCILLYSLCR
jgi:hypothetical protein